MHTCLSSQVWGVIAESRNHVWLSVHYLQCLRKIPAINWSLIIYLWMSKQTRLICETHSLLCEEKGDRQTKAITKQVKEWHQNKTSHAVCHIRHGKARNNYGLIMLQYCVLGSHLSSEGNCMNILLWKLNVQASRELAQDPTAGMYQVCLTEAQRFSPLSCPGILILAIWSRIMKQKGVVPLLFCIIQAELNLRRNNRESIAACVKYWSLCRAGSGERGRGWEVQWSQMEGLMNVTRGNWTSVSKCWEVSGNVWWEIETQPYFRRGVH